MCPYFVRNQLDRKSRPNIWSKHPILHPLTHHWFIFGEANLNYFSFKQVTQIENEAKAPALIHQKFWPQNAPFDDLCKIGQVAYEQS